MKLANIEMSNCLSNLKSISGKVTGRLAYAVSRNMRKLSNEVLEFETIKNNLIDQYGEKNEDGVMTIKTGTDSYKKFIEDISEYSDIAHEVDIYTIPSDVLYDSVLNADEMLYLDFMIHENSSLKM